MPDYLAPTVAFIVRFRPGWPLIVAGQPRSRSGSCSTALTADDWKEPSLHLSSGYLLTFKFIGAAVLVRRIYAFRCGPSGG